MAKKNKNLEVASMPVELKTKKAPVVPKVVDLEEKIRRALISQQTYSESLEIAISFAAGNYHAYLKCLSSINKRTKVMYKVLTREGSTAYKAFPDVELLPTLSRALKDSLKSIGLTLDTLEAVDNDPLDMLEGKVSELRNG